MVTVGADSTGLAGMQAGQYGSSRNAGRGPVGAILPARPRTVFRRFPEPRFRGADSENPVPGPLRFVSVAMTRSVSPAVFQRIETSLPATGGSFFRGFLLLALGLALVFAACGESQVAEEFSEAREIAVPPPAPAEDDPRPKLIAFGDSLTTGYGIEVTEAWPSRLQELLDAEELAYRVVNAGVSGETTSGGLRRLPWVLDRNPAAAVVVIALGGNDGLRGVPVDVMMDNLRGMIAEAEGRGLRVLLAGVPTPPELGRDYEDAFGDTFREVAAAAGVPLLPSLLEGVAGVAELNQRDGIHPTAEGARLLAENAFRALLPLLGEPARGSTVP